MAESPSNSLKRPHPEYLQNGGSTPKKIRSTNGSPAPQTNGSAAGKPDISKVMADARARVAAMAAKMQGSGARTNGVASPAPTQSTENTGVSRAEQLKARVAAAMAKTSASTEQRTASPIFQPPPIEESLSRARGGLGIGLHPSLMDTSPGTSKNKQAIQPKFATTMANRRTQSPADPKLDKAKKQLDLSGPSAEEFRNNPYFDASLGGQTATLKSRNARQLQFNAKGKYVQQGAALRRQAALEQLKQRVAASSKKAGIQDDPTEKNFKVEEPPSCEWWDENLLVDKNYDDLERTKIDAEDSIVTAFVQHPVMLEPPNIKMMPAPKPLPLTSKEQAKKRRMNRMEALKEQQAKERLGLVPVPEPKVKLGNLMRVLGEEAVKDPTAVEARVNRQIQERKTNHEEMNQERKLTKEQKQEKLEQKQAQDAAKGIHVAVWKINSLANGRHRFKVNKNAEQNSLTGTVICSPTQSLVIAEGGQRSMQLYKKVLNRVDWTENDIAPVREGNKQAQAAFLNSQEDDGTLKDLAFNRCTEIWEGETVSRGFRKWAFKVVETDKEAMDALSRAKMENFWTQAKSVP